MTRTDAKGGIGQAARALGRGAQVELAVDNDADALAVYRETFGLDRVRASMVDLSAALAERSGPKTKREALLLAGIERGVDIVLGGAPCQGHSDLNNHTRRDDDKNELYTRVARLVELVSEGDTPTVSLDAGGYLARHVAFAAGHRRHHPAGALSRLGFRIGG